MNKQTLTILTTVLTLGLSVPSWANDIPVYTAQPYQANKVNEPLQNKAPQKVPLQNKNPNQNQMNAIQQNDQTNIAVEKLTPNQKIEQDQKDYDTYKAPQEKQLTEVNKDSALVNQPLEKDNNTIKPETNTINKKVIDPNAQQIEQDNKNIVTKDDPNGTNIAVEKVTSGVKIEQKDPKDQYKQGVNPNELIENNTVKPNVVVKDKKDNVYVPNTDLDTLEGKTTKPNVTLEDTEDNTYTPKQKLDVIENAQIKPKATENMSKAKVDACEQLHTVCYISQTSLTCYDEINKESMGGFNNVTIKDLDFDKKNPNLYLLNDQNNVFVVTTANKNADGYDVIKAFMDGNDVSGDINHISFAGGALYVSTTENIIYKMNPTTRAIEELYVLPNLSVEIKDILAHDTPNGTNLYFVDDAGTLTKVDADGVAIKVAEDVTDAPGQIAHRGIDTNFTLFVSDEESGDVIRIHPNNNSVGLQTTFDELAHIHSTIDNRVLVLAQSVIKELRVTTTVTPDSLSKDLTEQAFKAAQGRICKIKPKQTLTKPESSLKGDQLPGIQRQPQDDQCVNPNMVYDKDSGECVCPEGYDEIPGPNGPSCELTEDAPQKFDFADNSSEQFEEVIDPSSQEVTPDASDPTIAYSAVGGACTLNTSRQVSTNGMAAFGLMMLGFALAMASKRQSVRVKSKK